MERNRRCHSPKRRTPGPRNVSDGPSFVLVSAGRTPCCACAALDRGNADILQTFRSGAGPSSRALVGPIPSLT